MKSRAIQGELVGNIGFMFGKWANMPENSSERERVLMQLKKQPAHIWCLAEAEEIAETTLRSAPSVAAGKDDDTSSAVADELVARKSCEYLVTRGNETSSILMVVRANVASSLECLHGERRLDGVDKRRIGYSRCMVGKVVLDKSVGHFGKEICSMTVYMHNRLANNIWSDKLTELWTWCHKLS
jgi:hypothetical protein